MFTIRWVAAIACGLFFGCAWLLSRSRSALFGLTILAVLLFPQNALASCTRHTVSGPDGKIQLCTTCCNSAGVCDTHCF